MNNNNCLSPIPVFYLLWICFKYNTTCKNKNLIIRQVNYYIYLRSMKVKSKY